MKIDRKLNLVLPLEEEDRTLYVHSMPISRPVFERYFRVISKTFNEIYTGGHGVISGPRVAAMLLKSNAETMGEWDGEAGVERGLMAEIRRLTNVVALTGNGWESVPYEVARKEGMLDDDTASEVENVIVFFIVASSVHLKAELPAILKTLSGLWNVRVESSNCTDFASSLATSTEIENTGEKVTRSLIPS